MTEKIGKLMVTGINRKITSTRKISKEQYLQIKQQQQSGLFGPNLLLLSNKGYDSE